MGERGLYRGRDEKVATEKTHAQPTVAARAAAIGRGVLYAGNDKVIGVKGKALIQKAPLELKDYNGSAGQIFELDGDSIIMSFFISVYGLMERE